MHRSRFILFPMTYIYAWNGFNLLGSATKLLKMKWRPVKICFRAVLDVILSTHCEENYAQIFIKHFVLLYTHEWEGGRLNTCFFVFIKFSPKLHCGAISTCRLRACSPHSPGFVVVFINLHVIISIMGRMSQRIRIGVCRLAFYSIEV